MELDESQLLLYHEEKGSWGENKYHVWRLNALFLYYNFLKWAHQVFVRRESRKAKQWNIGPTKFIVVILANGIIVMHVVTCSTVKKVTGSTVEKVFQNVRI